jgi:hypothetical protein
MPFIIIMSEIIVVIIFSIITNFSLGSRNDQKNLFESFEFLLKPGKPSFLRKQESSGFNKFLDSGFHRNDIFGRNSKLSLSHSCNAFYFNCQLKNAVRIASNILL